MRKCAEIAYRLTSHARPLLTINHIHLQLKVWYTRIRWKYCIVFLEGTPATAHTWKTHHWLSVSVLYRVDQYRCNQYILIAVILHLACAHTCVFLNCLKAKCNSFVKPAFYVYSAEQWGVAWWAKLTEYHWAPKLQMAKSLYANCCLHGLFMQLN